MCDVDDRCCIDKRQGMREGWDNESDPEGWERGLEGGWEESHIYELSQMTRVDRLCSSRGRRQSRQNVNKHRCPVVLLLFLRAL